MTVKEGYEKHRYSTERRNFARRLFSEIRRGRRKGILDLKVGKVYGFTNKRKIFNTDRWNVYSVVILTEVDKGHIEGYNFLYLPSHVVMNILTLAEKMGESNPIGLKNIINKELHADKYQCTRVFLDKKQLVSVVEIDQDDWGILPVMNRSIFGNTNFQGMFADWKKDVENAIEKVPFVKPEEEEEEEEEELDKDKIYAEELAELTGMPEDARAFVMEQVKEQSTLKDIDNEFDD